MERIFPSFLWVDPSSVSFHFFFSLLMIHLVSLTFSLFLLLIFCLVFSPLSPIFLLNRPVFPSPHFAFVHLPFFFCSLKCSQALFQLSSIFSLFFFPPTLSLFLFSIISLLFLYFPSLCPLFRTPSIISFLPLSLPSQTSVLTAGCPTTRRFYPQSTSPHNEDAGSWWCRLALRQTQV